jgi:hypothetical protein
MLTFEWNALRAGDQVFMHDATEATGTVIRGVVATVDMHKGYNGVGVRGVGVGARRGVVWPSPFVVHSDVSDKRCWRCQAA